MLPYRYPKPDITLPTSEQMEVAYWDGIKKENDRLMDALAAYPRNLIEMLSVKKAQKTLSQDLRKFIADRRKNNPKAWAKFEKEYAVWFVEQSKSQRDTKKRQK